MKTFAEIRLRRTRCRQEVLELRDRLASRRRLRERQDILPFLRDRSHLCALCGVYNPTVFQPNRIAWEYDVFGDFACDLAVGDALTKSFTFIEFEDARPGSLFVRHGRKAAREWSPRFLRGFSQLVDWFCKLDDRRNSDEFEARFGKRSIDGAGLLVAGRDGDLGAGERFRFDWWRENVVVRSRRVHCVTYDELVANLLDYLGASLEAFPGAQGPTGRAGRRGRSSPR
jgi:hypothetical protein